jgi:hypothetical protein
MRTAVVSAALRVPWIQRSDWVSLFRSALSPVYLRGKEQAVLLALGGRVMKHAVEAKAKQ